MRRMLELDRLERDKIRSKKLIINKYETYS